MKIVAALKKTRFGKTIDKNNSFASDLGQAKNVLHSKISNDFSKFKSICSERSPTCLIMCVRVEWSGEMMAPDWAETEIVQLIMIDFRLTYLNGSRIR